MEDNQIYTLNAQSRQLRKRTQSIGQGLRLPFAPVSLRMNR